MDPNATLSNISMALQKEDIQHAKDCCNVLFGWLMAGGFAPDWSRYPTAETFYRDWLDRRD